MKARKIQAIAPLQSWDIFSEYLYSQRIFSSRKADACHLQSLKSKFNWEFDIDAINQEDYTALVVTDSKQYIQWVNAGFTDMTGYPKSYAIGKHPRFLQGEETSLRVKSEINSSIHKGQVVKKQLINYKKDGSTYLCDIKIIPLYNHNQEVTHYLALEKKLKVA